jgi:hypothetical protein
MGVRECVSVSVSVSVVACVDKVCMCVLAKCVLDACVVRYALCVHVYVHACTCFPHLMLCSRWWAFFSPHSVKAGEISPARTLNRLKLGKRFKPIITSLYRELSAQRQFSSRRGAVGVLPSVSSSSMGGVRSTSGDLRDSAYSRSTPNIHHLKLPLAIKPLDKLTDKPTDKPAASASRKSGTGGEQSPSLGRSSAHSHSQSEPQSVLPYPSVDLAGSSSSPVPLRESSTEDPPLRLLVTEDEEHAQRVPAAATTVVATEPLRSAISNSDSDTVPSPVVGSHLLVCLSS